MPRPGRACSGHLVDGGGTRVAFDFGVGTYARLRMIAGGPESLDAIVISHMHADHFLDLVSLRYAIRYGPHESLTRLPLWLPPGGEKILRAMTAAFVSEGADFLDESFDVATFDPQTELTIGDLRLRFATTTHYIPCFAARIEHAGASIVYSADTAYDARVAEIARGCDLFLCEATLCVAEPPSLRAGHATAEDAGRMAREADAARLVLTHWTAECAIATLEAEARAAYAGPVAVADDGDVFTVA